MVSAEKKKKKRKSLIPFSEGDIKINDQLS